MDQKSLRYDIRTAKKKGAARKLRRSGKIPSIIYGRHAPVLIAVDEHEFSSKFKTVSESTIITLKSEKDSYDVLVKDYQEDIIKGKILHIDFYEIERGKPVRTHVPIRLEGAPIGVREGGLLESLTHEVEIECLPKNLPETIRIDVSGLGVGHSVHVRDIPEMEGIKFHTPADMVICTIVRKREAEVAEEEEEVALEEAEVQEEVEKEE